MGSNTLTTVGTGSPVESTGDLFDQYKTALIQDFLPRNASGVVTSQAGSLGSSSYVWNSAFVDNLKLDGNTISSTDTDGDINITPNGTGSLVASKVDINSGTIDGTAIGLSTPSSGAFTTLVATGDITQISASTDDVVHYFTLTGSDSKWGIGLDNSESDGFSLAYNATTIPSLTDDSVMSLSTTGNLAISGGISTGGNETIKIDVISTFFQQSPAASSSAKTNTVDLSGYAQTMRGLSVGPFIRVGGAIDNEWTVTTAQYDSNNAGVKDVEITITPNNNNNLEFDGYVYLTVFYI